uniref:FCP1 homology domain-containing protein n=1 Tax=Brassica campestris TaxID=3711 RepID=M4FAB2_BRACM
MEVNEKTPRPSAFNTQPPSSLDYVGPVCDKLHPNGYIPYKLPRGATKYDNRKRYRDLSTLNRDPKRILYVSGECKNNEDKDKADYGGVRRIIIMYSERRLYLEVVLQSNRRDTWQNKSGRGSSRVAETRGEGVTAGGIVLDDQKSLLRSLEEQSIKQSCL